MGRKKISSPLPAFSALPNSVKLNLAAERGPLHLGLAALAIAQANTDYDYLSIEDIVACLEATGVSAQAPKLQKAFARAGNKLAVRRTDDKPLYKIMIPGLQAIQDLLDVGNLEVIYVEGGRPRTARKKLAEILDKVAGTVRISDPYYGERTLDTLEMLAMATEVRFMTAHTSEKAAKVSRAISDFKREHPHVEFRQYPHPREMHDRYILTDDRLLIVGHGIKDIGNKESFLIVVDKVVAPDLIESVRGAFDTRWGVATAL